MEKKNQFKPKDTTLVTWVSKFSPAASLFLILNRVAHSFENKMVVKKRMNCEVLEREITETIC